MTIWKVVGELTTDSGTGGEETWYYITPDPLTLPDVRQRFTAPGSTNGRDWYQITRITLVADLPDIWADDDPAIAALLSEALERRS